MVEYYFENIDKQKDLKKVLDGWLGTPFRHHCGVKGLGCDCIHFGARIFEELGLLIDVVIPDYPKDGHLYNNIELLEEGIVKHLNVEEISLSNFMNGDIISSLFGKSAHLSIYFDGYLYQALNGIGVRKINFKDKKFKKRMKFAYRVLKKTEITIINEVDLDKSDKYLISDTGKNVIHKILKG